MTDKKAMEERAREIRSYLEKHEGKVTAKQAAAALNTYPGVIYRATARYGIRLIPEKPGKKPRISIGIRTKYCANRPDSCFDCPFPDCYCSEGMNEEEANRFMTFHGSGQGEGKIR